ncbi:outer membrane lipid asymmetry maintenance protein MlaD [Hyphococcus flavus]|uniref:Outer membrane lipid asymmetry maintenance protein MlaD n=1 Tax=Hyphococcus flavus TaxID=1866326 RepID=A0AAE9ZK04_9PROT|nr:outer membrane lipid asymmetry maintenance protein MlaD [Hyphococcus flavus]WDI32025.1 outer membrane lipid asymmetry maintenance protein MlaD [Hyphococcus flavus]
MSRAGFFETVVGVIVITVAAAFMVYAYGASGNVFGKEHYRLEAVFGKVDGVTVGSDVRIAGVKVGTVAANNLDLKTYEAMVSLAIDNGIGVPEDSVAKVVSDGLLGGAHIAIEPGAAEEMLREGDRITITQGSVDLLGLAVQAFTSQSGSGKKAQNADDPLGDF